MGNNPVEKLFQVLEMKLKTYTPVGPKFVFEKIKFKVFHCILLNNYIKSDKYFLFIKVTTANFLLKLGYL